MARRLLFYRDLQHWGVPFSRTHITRLERAGKFPRHVTMGTRQGGWWEDEIEAHVAAKSAERDKDAA